MRFAALPVVLLALSTAVPSAGAQVTQSRKVLTLEGARVDSNERLNLQVPLRFGGSP